MANWCNNEFEINVDTDHPSYQNFKRKADAFIRHASIENEHFKGVHPYNTSKFIFDLHISIQSYDLIVGSYETKWEPLNDSTFQALMIQFPCIKKIKVDYDEPNEDIRGVQNF